MRSKKLVNKELLVEYKNAQKKSKLSIQESNAIYNRLMEHQGKKKTRIAQVKKMYKTRQYSECTYQPKINKSSKKITQRKNISNRVNEILEKREKKRELMKRREQKSKEIHLMENCTFAPKINRKKKKRKKRRESKNKRKLREQEVFCLEMEEEGRRESMNPFFDRDRTVSKRRKSLVPQTSRRRNKSRKFSNRSLSPIGKTRKKSFSTLRRNKSRKIQMPRKPRKNPTKLMMNATNRRKTKRKKPSDPGIFTKRSIVVLNENDEFEDLNVYLEKQRKALEERSKLKTKEKELLDLEKMLREESAFVKQIEVSPNLSKSISNDEQERKVLGELLPVQMKKEVREKVVKKKIQRKKRIKKKIKKKAEFEKDDDILQFIDKENKFQGNLLDQRTVPMSEEEVEFNYTETNTVCELSKLKLSVIESPKRSETNEKNHERDRRDFLIINGEKIFFNESTISSIIDTNRIKKLANCFNQYK